MSTSPIKRWSVIATLVFALTLACGLCLIALTPKVYEATAQMEVMARGPMDQVGIINKDVRPLDESTFQPETQIIQSYDMLEPIITDLGLDKKWAQRFPTSDPLVFLAYLRSHLKLDMTAGTSVIRITYRSDVPTEAAEIANAIADRYKTMRDVEEDQRTGRGLDALRELITQQEKVVADARAAVAQIKKNLTDAGAPNEKITTDLELREADLLRAQEDCDARQVLWKRLAPLPDREFLENLQSLGGQHSRIEPGDDLPVRVAGLRRAMQIDCDMAKSRVDLLQQEMNTLKAAEAQNPRLAPLGDARRKLEMAQSLLDALNFRLRQVTADIALRKSPVLILTRAEAPSHPVQPNVPLDLLLFTVTGLMLGITVASFVELLLWLRR